MKEATQTPAPATSLWIRVVVLILGVCYLTLAIIGFVKYAGQMGADPNRAIGGFGFSGFLNIAHVPAGVLGLLATYQERTARVYGWLTFFAASGLTAYGIVANVTSDLGNVANVRIGNIVLYAITAIIGVTISLIPTSNNQENTDEQR